MLFVTLYLGSRFYCFNIKTQFIYINDATASDFNLLALLLYLSNSYSESFCINSIGPITLNICRYGATWRYSNRNAMSATKDTVTYHCAILCYRGIRLT